jgi:hypothetical protein
MAHRYKPKDWVTLSHYSPFYSEQDHSSLFKAAYEHACLQAQSIQSDSFRLVVTDALIDDYIYSRNVDPLRARH